jgi:hypothetical protein
MAGRPVPEDRQQLARAHFHQQLTRFELYSHPAQLTVHSADTARFLQRMENSRVPSTPSVFVKTEGIYELLNVILGR